MKQLIEFSATWCAPCKMIAPVVEQLKSQYNGKLEITQYDAEEHEELAQQYNVRNVPTFIFLDNGTEIARLSGAVNKQKIADFIEMYI